MASDEPDGNAPTAHGLRRRRATGAGRSMDRAGRRPSILVGLAHDGARPALRRGRVNGFWCALGIPHHASMRRWSRHGDAGSHRSGRVLTAETGPLADVAAATLRRVVDCVVGIQPGRIDRRSQRRDACPTLAVRCPASGTGCGIAGAEDWSSSPRTRGALAIEEQFYPRLWPLRMILGWSAVPRCQAGSARGSPGGVAGSGRDRARRRHRRLGAPGSTAALRQRRGRRRPAGRGCAP